MESVHRTLVITEHLTQMYDLYEMIYFYAEKDT